MEFYQIYTEAFAIKQNKLYFSDMQNNGLYVYNILSGITRFVGYFPEEPVNIWRQHCNAFAINKDIYFLPWRARHLHIFHLKEEVFETIGMPFKEESYMKNAFIYKNEICILKHYPCNELLRFDIRTKRIKCLPLLNREQYGVVSKEYYIEDDMLFLVFEKCNIICEINLQTEEKTYYEIASDISGIGTVVKYNNDFFASTQNTIVRWSLKEKKIKNILKYPDEFGVIYKDKSGHIYEKKGFKTDKDNEMPFSCSAVLGNEIVFFPNRANMILSYSLINDSLKEWDELQEKETEKTLNRQGRISQMHYIGKDDGERYYVVSVMNGKIYCYKKEDGLRKDDCVFYTHPLEKYLFETPIVIEKNNIKLFDYVSFMRGYYL